MLYRRSKSHFTSCLSSITLCFTFIHHLCQPSVLWPSNMMIDNYKMFQTLIFYLFKVLKTALILQSMIHWSIMRNAMVRNIILLDTKVMLREHLSPLSLLIEKKTWFVESLFQHWVKNCHLAYFRYIRPKTLLVKSEISQQPPTIKTCKHCKFNPQIWSCRTHKAVHYTLGVIHLVMGQSTIISHTYIRCGNLFM